MNDYLVSDIVKSNKVADFTNYRGFLRNRYVLVKPFRIKGKEIVKENSFWNNVNITVNRYVNVGV